MRHGRAEFLAGADTWFETDSAGSVYCANVRIEARPARLSFSDQPTFHEGMLSFPSWKVLSGTSFSVGSLITSMGSRQGGERSVVHRYYEEYRPLFAVHQLLIRFVVPLDASGPSSGLRATDRGPAA